VAELAEELDRTRQLAGSPAGSRVFAVGPSGDIIALRAGQRPRPNRSQALVVWKPSF
jgi:MerR family transcriptional regulator/heat shock protein HspR